MCEIASGKPLSSTWNSAWCSVVSYMGGIKVSGKEAQEGGEKCVLMADLHCYTAEANRTS